MASLLIIDDEPAITSAYASFFRRTGSHTVAEAHSGEEGIAAWRRLKPDVTLLDVRLPDMTGFDVLGHLRHDTTAVIMITGHGDIPMAVKALQSGADNFLSKPVDMELLQFAVERAIETTALRRLNRFISDSREAGSAVVMGSSAPMRELSAQIELLAASDRTTGLIIGESGTGKGRVAEMIHASSARRTGAFVDVNCGALTADAFDAELFGVAGRNDGEIPRDGRLDIADGGTLFLDEVADLNIALQPKLIRVLEGKSYRRVGGSQERIPNVRVLAATTKDLVAEVNSHRFREDLYYRLSVMPVVLPPLRARAREDLVELIGHILKDLATQLPGSPTRITDEALDHLLRYSWPGNIREMRNVVERALLLSRGCEKVEAGHLPVEVRGLPTMPVELHAARTLDEVERAHIERTLRANNQNRSRAARELGISRATLIKKIKQYRITAESDD